MELEYPNINTLDFSPPEKGALRYAKKTLLYSPIITKILPNFKVNYKKPFRGIPSTSFNDEADQYLAQKKEDSQKEVFNDDEDEILLGLEEPRVTITESIEVDIYAGSDSNSQVEKVQVIVKTTSLLVDDIEFHLNSSVRSSCLVQSRKSDDEDSLLLSLKSGYLLLIRMFYVPIDQKDTDFQMISAGKGAFILKPYIVQWWDISADLSIPLLESSGHQLACDRTGNFVISCSASYLFRIYCIESTKYGMSFSKHLNVHVDGFIFHSCFAEPIDARTLGLHYVFMALVFTNNKRLIINLFEWGSDKLLLDLKRTAFPLRNTFSIPIMVIPMSSLKGFLFVYEDSFLIVTIHNIKSAEYDFRKIPFNGSFPTSFYRPETKILDSENEEEILISSDNGVVFVVHIDPDQILSCTPVARIADLISNFVFERSGEGYYMSFASDTGSNRELLIPELLAQSEAINFLKLKYSLVELIKDYKNWSPILDVIIIDAQSSRYLDSHSDQELWAITGTGKRTRLTHLRKGYLATKRSKTIAKLRKALFVKIIRHENEIYILCSLPFETLLLEFEPTKDEFSEIEDALIIKDKSTVFIINFPEVRDALIQVYDSGLILTNLSQYQHRLEFEDKKLILCDQNFSFVSMVFETLRGPDRGKIILQIFRIGQVIEWKEFDFVDTGALSEPLLTAPLKFEPSMVKLLTFQNSLYICIGSYSGNLEILQFQNGSIVERFQFNMNELHSDFDGNNVSCSDSLLVPNDIVSIDKSIFVGTKDGFLIELLISDWKVEKFFSLGISPVTFCISDSCPRHLFIHSRSVWLLNFDNSPYPDRIFFDERIDRPVMVMESLNEVTADVNNSTSFVLVREEGLVVASVPLYLKPCVKQVNLLGPSKRLFYLPNVSLFVMSSNLKDLTLRLKIVDRKTLKLVTHEEVPTRLGKDLIFKRDEIPSCFAVWEIKRSEKFSKKLVVGSIVEHEKGSIKVLDVIKTPATSSKVPSVRIIELTSFEHPDPISCVTQVNSDIVFSSGNTVYSTKYHPTDKRLSYACPLVTLGSDITSLLVSDNSQLFVSTKSDSIYQFTYEPQENTGESVDMLKLVASDPFSASLVSQASLGSKIFVGEKLQSSVIIMNRDDVGISHELEFGLGSIPRVFSSSFSSRWFAGKSNETNNVLCVGVNGEVVSIKLVYENGEDTKHSKWYKLLKSLDDFYSKILDKHRVPFIDKVTGKGLISLNKFHLNLKKNRETSQIFDYDLDEISKYSLSSVTI